MQITAEGDGRYTLLGRQLRGDKDLTIRSSWQAQRCGKQDEDVSDKRQGGETRYSFSSGLGLAGSVISLGSGSSPL